MAIAPTATSNPFSTIGQQLLKALRPSDARLLGFALLVPVFEVFRRISFCLPAALVPNNVMGHVCTAAVVGGALAATATIIARSRLGRAPRPQGRSLAAGILGIAAFATMAASLALGTATACTVIAYTLLGSSLALLFLGWVDAYGRRDAKNDTLTCALSTLIGNLPMALLIALKDPWAMGLLLGGCLLASCALLLSLDHADTVRSANRAQPAPEKAALGKNADSPGWPSLFREASSAPAFGFVMLFFSWGIMAVPPHSYASDHNSWVYLIGNLLAVIMAAWFVCSLGADARYTAARQKAFFILPVLAMFVGYFSFIRMLNTGGALKNVLSVGYNMSTVGFAALFVGTTAMRSHERGTPCVLAVGPVVILGLAEYGCGALAYALLGNEAMYIQIVQVTLYIVALSFLMTRKASLNDEARIGRRVEQLATQCGLSTREREILLLLASDYSVERISEQLTISTETVRTHKKRIYAKVGVHKHEDLMRTVRAQG